MSKELFVKAEEVSKELGISKPYAYKLVREMNEELKQKGFITIPGRVSRRYFEGVCYGLRVEQYGGNNDASVHRQGERNMVCVLLLRGLDGQKGQKDETGVLYQAGGAGVGADIPATANRRFGDDL